MTKEKKNVSNLNVVLPTELIQKLKSETKENNFQTMTSFLEDILEKTLYHDSELDLRDESIKVRKEYFNIDMPIVKNDTGYILAKNADNTKIELIILGEDGNHSFETVELLKFSEFKKEKFDPQNKFGVNLELEMIYENHNIRTKRGYYTAGGTRIVPGVEQRKYFSYRGYDYYHDHMNLVDDYNSFKKLIKLIELPHSDIPNYKSYTYPENWNQFFEDAFREDNPEYSKKSAIIRKRTSKMAIRTTEEVNYLRWEWFKHNSRDQEDGKVNKEWEQAIKGNIKPLLNSLRAEKEEYRKYRKKMETYHTICEKEEQTKAQLEKAEQYWNQKMMNREKVTTEDIDLIQKLTEEYDALRKKSFEEAKKIGIIGELSEERLKELETKLERGD